MMADRSANRTFQKKDVLKATSIPNQTFQHWYDRRVVPLSSDDCPGGGKGRPRRFGLRSIHKLAIAHRISLLGVPANLAVSLASKFTDMPQYGRPLGGLFPVGLTVIIATPGGTGTVVNLKPEEDIGTLLQDASIVVNVNEIISKINFEVGTPK
jgi:hypothetical protein